MAQETRVWVGCVGCYSAGRLVGDWHDAVDAGDLTVADLHDGKPCPNDGEELHCYDSEGLGGGEFSPGEAAKRARLLAEHDNPDALLAYWQSVGGSLQDAADSFADAYCGSWDSGEDYAEQLADDIGAVDRRASWPLSCIDWSAAWRELTYDSYWASECPDGGVYIFRSV